MTTTDKAAADRAAAHKGAAVEGAASVAEAVRRVADAAVAEVQKSNLGPAPEFQFTGTIGGKFYIKGDGFSSGGTVKVNGVQCKTHGWGAQNIDGWLPAELKAGTATVEVIVDESTRKQGTFKL